MPDRYYTYGSYSFIWDEDKNKLNLKSIRLTLKRLRLYFQMIFESNLKMQSIVKMSLDTIP